MIKRPNTKVQRVRRHQRVRGKVSGTAERPRLSVFRSENNIYAQIIDDVAGKTLCSASTVEKGFEGNGGNCEAAAKIGKLVGERAVAAGITEVVFDRGGNVYHGRVKALEYIDKIRARVGLKGLAECNPSENLTTNKDNLLEELLRERAMTHPSLLLNTTTGFPVRSGRNTRSHEQ